jgi:hypothetical protein
MHPFLSALNAKFAKNLKLPFQKYDIINMDLSKSNINYIENAILSAKEGGFSIFKKKSQFSFLKG